MNPGGNQGERSDLLSAIKAWERKPIADYHMASKGGAAPPRALVVALILGKAHDAARETGFWPPTAE